MKRLIVFILTAVFSGFIPIAAFPGVFDGSQPLLCAVIETFECSAGMECERGFAQSIDLPQFLRIDCKKKEISGTLENGRVKTTKIENMKPVADRLILHGVEEGVGWSIAIMEKSGKMVLSAAGESVGFTVFGACAPISEVGPEAVSASVYEPEQFELIWSALQIDKKLLFAEAILLTDQESNAFWPIYEAFQNDLKTIAAATFTLLGTYAAKYGELSDDDAGSLLNEYLDIEEKRVTLKKSYVKKLEDVLPKKKLMRYFQLENKIEATLKYELARNIPLAE